MSAARRLQHVTLEDPQRIRRNPVVEHERSVALADLMADSTFFPRSGTQGEALFEGPYSLHLEVIENRLQFDIRSENGADSIQVMLPLSPLRSVIKDYFIICESYYHAIEVGNHPQLEAIDMGRRGVHNEGSELLKDLLGERIEMDFDTARRLFTLICVLHIRSGAEVR